MKKFRTRSSRRAFALVTVICILVALSIAAGAMLSSVTFEKKLTRRTSAISELKQQTDALLNYAGAQALAQPTTLPNGIKTFPTNFFKGGSDAYSLSDFSDQEVIYTKFSQVMNSAGTAPAIAYINPNAPINRNDDLRDKNVYRYLFFIGSKSSVKDPVRPSERLTEYAVMILERRQFSIFNYLAFFDVAKFRVSNPGSEIILDGPVHSNLGIEFTSSSSNSAVKMLSTVTTPGSLTYSGSTAAGKFYATDGTLKTDGTPTLVDMLKPKTTSIYQTSDGTTFNNFMLNNTKGMLKTGAVGATNVEIDGLNFADDSTSTSIPDAYKLVNNRRIDPPNPDLRNSTNASYSDARLADAIKTAYSATLYTYVETDGTVTVFTNEADAESYKFSSNKTAWKATNLNKYVAPSEVKQFISMPYVERYNDGGLDYTTASKNTDLARGAIFDSQQKKTVSMVDVNIGALKTKLESGSVALAGGGTWNTKDSEKGWNGIMYIDVANPATRVAAPIVDKTTGYYLDPITKLPNPLLTADTALKSSSLPSLNITNTAQSWENGAAVDDSTGLTGVRIKNAQSVPRILTSTSESTGFTLATNTATYTVGSVNADGNMSTGTTSLQDDQTKATDTSTKVMASIFSDKNIVLSDDFSSLAYDLDLYVPKPASKGTLSQKIYDNWPFTGPSESSSTYSLGGSGNGQYFYQRDPGNRAAGIGSGTGNRNMELSCAFLVGDDDSSNKGIHTILSYLQPFSATNDVLRMRGAIIGVYKSRYFNAKAGSFNDYYTAPQRTFGYSSLFKAGQQLPGAPKVSNYRRMRQFVISKADYDALKASNGTVDAWLAILQSKY